MNPNPFSKIHLRNNIWKKLRCVLALLTAALPVTSQAVPTTGEVHYLTLLVEFPNQSATYNKTSFNTLLFGGDGSLKDYYSKVSANQMTLGAGPGGIGGWYRASRNVAWYGDDFVDDPATPQDESGWDARLGAFVQEVVGKADAAGFDFGPYDQDNDGVVDMVNILFAGASQDRVQSDKSLIWPQSSSLANRGLTYTTRSGKTINRFTVQGELDYTGANWHMATIGIFAHEFGHALGLPDLYDTRGTGDYAKGIGTGHWCLMGGGHHQGLALHGDSPTHMSAWAKMRLNWLTPVNITQNTRNVTVFPNGSGNFALRLRSPGMPASEYFLLENRQKELNYDRNLPASGLLIWHIDDAVANTNWGNTRQWKPGRDAAQGHYWVALEQADGDYTLDMGDVDKDPVWDAGDVFVPGRTFDNNSNPNSKSYSGATTNIAVRNIRASGNNFIVDIEVAPVSPDTAAPAIFITTPLHNASGGSLPSAISGTASDGTGYSASGLQSTMQLTIQNGSDYWTGSGWTGTASTINVPVNTFGQWSFTNMPGSPVTRPGTYTIVARIRDNANNLSPLVFAQNSINISVDRSEPSLDILSPVSGSTIASGSYSFNGLASDPGGVSGLSIYLRRNTDNYYWNAGGWQNTPFGLSRSFSAGTWNSTGTLPAAGSANMPNGVYTFIVVAQDTAGNSRQRDSIVNVGVFPRFVFTNGGGSGTWNDPNNWSPAGVPGSNADVDIGMAVILGGSRTVHKATMLAGSLNDGSLTVTGLFVWRAGVIYGTVNVPAGGAASITGDEDKMIDGYYSFLGNNDGRLNISGSAVWTGAGNIYIGNSTAFPTVTGALTINPTGILTIQTDADTSGAGLLINNGVMRKLGTSGDTDMASELRNGTSAVVDVLGGSLTLGGGGTSGGQFLVSSPASLLTFSAGSHYLLNGTFFSGPGTCRCTGGRVYFSAGTPAPTITVGSDTTLELTDEGGFWQKATLAGSGKFRWSGGTIYSELTIGPDIAIEVTGALTKQLEGYYSFLGNGDNGILRLLGNTTWKGTGPVTGANGAQILNSGVLNIEGDGGLNVGESFVNTGTLRRINNDGVIVVAGSGFRNSGVMDVQTGGIRFDNALEMTANSTITGAGRLIVKSELTANGVINGNARLEIDEGSVVGTPLFLQSSLTWKGGTIYGHVTIGPLSTLRLEGPDNKVIEGYYSFQGAAWEGKLTMAGNMYLEDSGDVALNNGAVFRNLGYFYVESGADLIGDGRVDNEFVIIKRGSAETSAISCVFNNKTGVLDVQDSEVTLLGGGESSGSWMANTMNVVTPHPEDAQPAPSTSPVRIRISGGTWNLKPGTVFQGGGTVAVESGILNGALASPVSVVITDDTTLEVTGDATVDKRIHLTGGGTFVWSSGTLMGHLSTDSSISSRIRSAATKTLEGYYSYTGDSPAIFENGGTCEWTGGNIAVLNGGGTGNGRTGWIKNSGTWTSAAGSAVLSGGPFTNSGYLKVGAFAGTFHLSTADFEQTAAGTLHLEFAGAANTQFDRVLGANNAMLAGSLVLSRLNYTPAGGVSFTVMDWTSRAGTFSSIESNGLALTPSYQASALVLTSGVSTQELTAWKTTHFGSPTAPSAASSADPDKDGNSNLTEYVLGGNPTTGGDSLVRTVPDDTRLTIGFSRVAGANVDLTVMATNDLGNWQEIAHLPRGSNTWTGAATVTETGTGNVRVVTVRDTVNTQAGNLRFMQVLVEE